MPFDFKKEYKEFYRPKTKPEIVTLPPVNYLAVSGKGDPNQPDGEYQCAISALYAVSYTLRMSCKTAHPIDGFFEYVVPPLEGFWWQEGAAAADFLDKSHFQWLLSPHRMSIGQSRPRRKRRRRTALRFGCRPSTRDCAYK